VHQPRIAVIKIMTKKKITYFSIFLICVAIPILTLSLFPTPCGYGLCLLFYYPFIFLVGGLSAFFYLKFSDRLKLNKAVFFLIILLVDFTLLTYLYPKGEYFPLNQIQIASQVDRNYENLKPIDIFKAIEDRNFLQITALYHKFNLPPEIYDVSYCFIDSNESCDTIYRKFNYFIMDNKIVSNNPDFNYNLDLNEGDFSFIDNVEQNSFKFKVGYPDFGKYKKSFTNTSSEISDKGERITGLVKDTEALRVMVFESKPKFEYGFTSILEKYLDLTK
jgi:hypothetical protein